MSASTRDDGAPRPRTLSSRGRALSALVAEGLTNAEIAERLDLDPRSVVRDLDGVLRALGLKTRLRLAVWATEAIPWASRVEPASSDRFWHRREVRADETDLSVVPGSTRSVPSGSWPAVPGAIASGT